MKETEILQTLLSEFNDKLRMLDQLVPRMQRFLLVEAAGVL